MHIQGTRRQVTDCPPFRFLKPAHTDAREAGVRANAVHVNPKIRAAAAASYSAPADVLDALACDAAEEVREWVARNENTELSTLTLLARDEKARVRAYVAWNPGSGPSLLQELSRDDNMVVRELATQRLDGVA